MGNGIWKLRVCAGYENGKKNIIQKHVQIDPKKTPGAQLKEAQKLTAKLEEEYENGSIAAVKSMTFAEYAQHWEDTYCKRRGTAASTVKGYRDLLQGRILPALGKLRLREIKPLTVNRFFQAMEEETPKLSGTYIRKYFNLLHLILRCAVQERMISLNPTDCIEPPTKDTVKKPVYSAAQVASLLEALQATPLKWQAYTTLAMYTQMRRGELIGLNWDNIDFSQGLIHVEHSACYVPGAVPFLKAPKTRAGKRTIHVSKDALEPLQQWRREQASIRLLLGNAWQDEGAVFTQDNGVRLHVCTPTGWHKDFLEKNGLPHINLHGLRHTGASLLVADGLDYTSLSHRLGHSRPSTSADLYSTAYEERDAAASENLSRIFANSK